MKKELSDQPGYLRRTMDEAADAFVVHDIAGRIMDVNRRACQSLGYEREELLGLNVADIELNLDAEQVVQFWEEVKPGQTATIQGRHRRKDGSIFPVEVRVGLLSDTPGQPEKRLILALVRDISERKATESRLQAAETARHQAEAAVLQEREQAALERAAKLFEVNQALKRNLEVLAEPNAAQLELTDFLQRVIDEATQGTSAAMGQIFLFDDTQTTLSLAVVSGDKDGKKAEMWREPRLPGDSPAWKRLLETRMPLVINFAHEGFALWPEAIPWHRQCGHQRGLCVALRLEEQSLGFLGLAFCQDEALSPETVELAQVFAGQATLAIQLTRLAEVARQKATQAAVLDERNLLAHDIHDTLAQSFVGIVALLEAATVGVPDDSKPHELLVRARNLAREGLQEARRSVGALRLPRQ